MFWLGLCVLFSTVIYLLFRAFGKRGLPLLPIVAINYVVCLGFGLLMGADFTLPALYAFPALPLLLLQGTLFITFFFLLGYSTHRAGVAYTTVISKLSVVIPVLAALVVFGERLLVWQWVGVGAALAATVLINLRSGTNTEAGLSKPLLLGVVIFIGTGIIDTNFKVYNQYVATLVPEATFVTGLFGVAACLGVVAVGYQVLFQKLRLPVAVWVAGFLLGLVNYGSIFFLVKGLKVLPAAVFFPANNIAQLTLGSLVGVLVFREPFSRLNWVGLGLAVTAILLLTFAR